MWTEDSFFPHVWFTWNIAGCMSGGTMDGSGTWGMLISTRPSSRICSLAGSSEEAKGPGGTPSLPPSSLFHRWVWKLISLLRPPRLGWAGPGVVDLG